MKLFSVYSVQWCDYNRIQERKSNQQRSTGTRMVVKFERNHEPNHERTSTSHDRIDTSTQLNPILKTKIRPEIFFFFVCVFFGFKRKIKKLKMEESEGPFFSQTFPSKFLSKNDPLLYD